jgi:hypothetical protein
MEWRVNVKVFPKIKKLLVEDFYSNPPYDMSKYTIDEIKNKFKNIDVPDNYFTKRMKSAEDQLWNCKCKYHLFSKIAHYSLIIISSIPAIVFSVDLLKNGICKRLIEELQMQIPFV